MKNRVLSIALALTLILSLAISASAAETKNYKVNADYNKDGKTDFSYTIPDVMKAEKIKFAASPSYKGSSDAQIYELMAGKEMNVYTISTGTKIDLTGAFNSSYDLLLVKDGKLYEDPQEESWGVEGWDKVRKIEVIQEQVLLNGGTHWRNRYMKGSNVSFIKEGYYLFTIYDFVPQVAYTDVNSPDFAASKVERFAYGTVVLHVVKDEAVAESPATAKKVYKFSDIPKSWIKETKANGVVTGYIVTVPNNKTASFMISGTQFESVKVKKGSDKFGNPVKLEAGKQKTFKDVNALSLTLRKTGK